jgi:GTP pyrophosphokinase
MSTLQTALLVALLLAPWGAQTDSAPQRSFVDEIALSTLEDAAIAMLSESGLRGSISARVKSPESLADKARRKGMRPDEVLDRVGLRVQVDTVEDCYAVFDQLHSRYLPVPGSQDDYIAHPKANGYQSLHTAVRTPVGVAEFQIRTPEMHAHAEHGGAAHASYKAEQGAQPTPA